MSDYYRLTLDFPTRRDMPAPVAAALTALSNGGFPNPDRLETMPRLIAHYLGRRGNSAPVGLGGASWRFTPLDLHLRDEKPDDATHMLHMERVFHDDEFANAGGIFLHWLFQFARDGHLAVELTQDGNPPTLYTRRGGDIVTTVLAYDPAEFATPPTRTPRPKHPIIVLDTTRQPLAPMVKLAEAWDPQILFG